MISADTGVVILIVETLLGIGVIYGTIRSTLGSLRTDLQDIKPELRNISVKLNTVELNTNHLAVELTGLKLNHEDLDRRLRYVELSIARLTASQKED